MLVNDVHKIVTIFFIAHYPHLSLGMCINSTVHDGKCQGCKQLLSQLVERLVLPSVLMLQITQLYLQYILFFATTNLSKKLWLVFCFVWLWQYLGHILSDNALMSSTLWIHLLCKTFYSFPLWNGYCFIGLSTEETP